MISAFTQGLREYDFLKLLAKKQLITFVELLAQKYVNVEEVQISRRGEPKNQPNNSQNAHFISDLEQNFQTSRDYELELNSSKYEIIWKCMLTIS